jgi:hypothetical protein
MLRTKTIIIICLLLILTSVLLAGYLQPQEKAPTFTSISTIKNPLYSADLRGNGAMVIYTVNSDVDAYCIPNPTETTDEMIRHEGPIFMHAKTIKTEFFGSTDSPYYRCQEAVTVSNTITIWVVLDYEFLDPKPSPVFIVKG